MIRNLLFDLDGTLVDSSGTIASALEYALEQAGVAAPEPARLRSFIGRPLLAWLLGKAQS
jgi:phosphoglycolate phosphatase-like HAD superfamily hydrolase